MIGRAVTWMEQGVDPEIRAYAREPSYPGAEEGQLRSQEIALSAPAQVIDDVVYLPARDVLRGNAELYGDTIQWEIWKPATQEAEITLILPCIFRAGDRRYVGYYYGEINDNAWTFPVPPWLLYGELMIPVYSSETQGQQNLWGKSEWDEAQKSVTIYLSEQYPPSR